jgi:hypothetical protein
MGTTLTNIVIHVTFSTKNREPKIVPEIREELNRYIGGKDCHSEEANHELYSLEDSDRPTKNLSFPKPRSVFCCIKVKLFFPAGLNQRFFGRLGFRNITTDYNLFRL